MFGKYTLVGMLLTFWVWHIAELLYEHRTYDVWMHNYDLTENGPICFESFIINCLDHVIRWRVSTKRGMVVKSLRSLAGTLLLRDNVVHVLPGQGSEDVEVLPDGTAIFSSGLNYMRNPVLKNVPGRMMMFDFKRPAEPAIELRLLEFKGKLNPHGISLWTNKGATFVYIVQHAMDEKENDESVEKFLLQIPEKTLTHMKSFKDPSFTSLNDLVVVGEDQFYATNDYIFRNNWIRRLEYFSFLPINNVVYYDGSQGYTAAAFLRRPNGINVSPDQQFLYVGESSARQVTSFKISPDRQLTKVESTDVGALVDNINIDSATGNLWVGLHPVGYKIFWKVMFPVGSTAPSLVLRIKAKNGRFQESRQIYADNGSNLIASGSAAFYKDALLIGTPTHKLMYCECLSC